MCKLKERYTKSDTVTGYKIAIEDKHGNYYSPSTGIRYNVGKVRIPKKRGKHAGVGWEDPLDKYNFFHSPGYKGFTSIIIHKSDVIEEFNDISPRQPNYVILEMTLTNDLHTASFNGCSTIAGKEIVSMKKIYYKITLMEKLKNIIRNSNMSTRPEYYSGRGATLSDLNSDILQKIYLGIKNEFGQPAAKNYVKMVVDIKVLSATTFLTELYNLFYNNWKYKTKKKHAPGIAIQKNENGEYDKIHGMISIMSTMGNSIDQTQSIKTPFCITHDIKLKPTMFDANRCSAYYEF